METKLSLLIQHLETLDLSDLVSINNQYCQNNNYNDDEIYGNDEDFFETFFSTKLEAVRAVAYGEYNYAHDYVRFNWYGNVESFDTFAVSDMVESPEKIAEDIIENPSDYSHAIDLDDIVGFDDAPDTDTDTETDTETDPK